MIEWEHGKYPCEELPGIYATLYCWDSCEGAWSGVNYWDWHGWEENSPVIAFAGPFDTVYEADTWLEEHDNSF